MYTIVTFIEGETDPDNVDVSVGKAELDGDCVEVCVDDAVVKLVEEGFIVEKGEADWEADVEGLAEGLAEGLSEDKAV